MLYEILGFRDNEFTAGLGWHDRVLEGFPQTSIWSLARTLGVTAEDMAQLIAFPVEELNWRNRKEPISIDLSDTLLRIAVAYHRLHVLFKNPNLCSTWLRTVRKETMGQIPVLLLTTSPGSKVVYEAIEKIKPVKQVEMRASESEEDSESERDRSDREDAEELADAED